MGGGGADEEWSGSEGVVVERWDDGLGQGEWYVEVEEWMKKRKGKKRKSKAMYAVASALLFKTKEEAEAYVRSAGLGNGEDGDNGDEGGDGDRDKGGDGREPLAPSPTIPDMESDNGAPGARSKAGAASKAGAGAEAREWG